MTLWCMVLYMYCCIQFPNTLLKIFAYIFKYIDFPGGSDSKASVYNAGSLGLIPESGRFPWRRKWHPSPVFLPGKPHGQRSLVGYSPWGRKELDTTEQLHFHFQMYRSIILFFCSIFVWSEYQGNGLENEFRSISSSSFLE